MLDDGTTKPRGKLFKQWLTQFDVFSHKNEHFRMLRIDPIFDNRELLEKLIARGN